MDGRDKRGKKGVVPSFWPNQIRMPEEHIERPSVDTLLSRAVKRRVCLVIGAAGWGKSTAVAAWSRNRPTAWLQCHATGTDASSFLAGLLRALPVDAAPHASRQDADSMVTDQVGSSVIAICAYLQAVLSSDLIFVLDDLHELQPNSDAARAVESLCRRAPERLHLVLISRHEPSFSLQRLRGRGFVSEIDAPDLAFTLADVETLLRKTVGDEPPGLSRQIWEHAEGWPAAVQYAIEMLRRVTVNQRITTAKRLCEPGELFYGYLSEEVVGALPCWARQLLCELAIFDEVGSSAEIMPGRDDQTVRLAELARYGLVRRSEGDRVGWTLIRPLRDFFRYGPTLSVNDRITLHVEVAAEYIERGALADALRHFHAAGNHATCASLVAEHGAAMVESGALDAVLQIAELPARYLDCSRIHLILGQALQVRGQWAEALEHFERIIRHRDKMEPALSWRVGSIAFAAGEFTDVQTLVRRTRIGREDTLDETRVLALSASAYRMTGNLNGLREMAFRTHAAARRCSDPRAWGSAHHVLALLATAEGNWLQTNIHYTDACHSAQAGDDLLQLTWIWISRAFYQFEAGAPRRANDDAETALRLSNRCESPFFIAHALTTRGRARARLGMLDAATSDFINAISLFQHIGSRFLAWPLCGLADLHRIRGQLTRARAGYEEALTLGESHHDVFSLSSALIGLARVTAVDDLALARECAARSVNLNEELRIIPALLARGWVELMGGDRDRAFTDANRATDVARIRGDAPGLAEALTLSMLASPNPARDVVSLREAVDIWQETGCRLEEAATRITAARISAPTANHEAHPAYPLLRDQGINVELCRAAGPLGVLARIAPTVSIQSLGAFRVIRNGTPIPNNKWQSKKAQELLKIMIAHRRPISRDQLIELLWPDVDPIVANNRLSVVLWKVRNVLQPEPIGQDPLIVTDGVLSLNAARICVDVEHFLTQAATALDADQANKPDATARLIASVAAHTGGFLENDPHRQWAEALTEEVQATYINLLRALIVRLYKAGGTDTVVYYALRLLQQDSYDEDTHLMLIKLQAAAGHLGEAHRHYYTYVRRMKEINIKPCPLSVIVGR